LTPEKTLYRSIEAAEPAPKGVRTRESTLAFLAGLSADLNMLKMPSLCLWTSLQALGREGILQRLRSAFEASETLHNKLAKFPRLRLLVRNFVSKFRKKVTSVFFFFTESKTRRRSKQHFYYGARQKTNQHHCTLLIFLLGFC
jgi:hypothetical protein